MDPSEYLSFSAVDLVTNSRQRRGVENVSPDRFEGIDPNSLLRRSKPLQESEPPAFSFFFAKDSPVSTYLKGKSKVGNCRVFLNGLIVVGPRWDGLLVSVSMLLLMGLQVIVGTTLPLIKADDTNVADRIMAWVVSVDFVLCVVLMLLTGLTNPGIIPRSETEGIPVGADPRSVDSATGFLIPRYLLLNGVGIRQKYCRTCRIYRPPRSNHCTVCDNCCLRHDHHCLALGTCVGLGNYRWFLLLSAGLTLLCPLVFWLLKNQLMGLYYALPQDRTAFQFVCDNSMSIIVSIAAQIGSVAFLLLFVYHYFITAHNLTTNEHLKKYYKVNPFDYGKLANFRHVMCAPYVLLPTSDIVDIEASYRELGSTNSECISDFYDY